LGLAGHQPASAKFVAEEAIAEIHITAIFSIIQHFHFPLLIFIE
jgi:hypothetical protein